MGFKEAAKAKFGVPEDATTKEALVGKYDYSWLCTPRVNPWTTKNRKPSLFYGLNDNLGLVVALVMGLQHAFAMIGGIVTPPLLVGGTQKNPEVTRYLVNAALICSGLCTFLQVFQVPLFGKYKLGSGVLSVMGTSFTSLNLALSSIDKLTKEDGKSWKEAYGAVIGTLALCTLLQVGISFLPAKAIRRTVPPLVSGITVFLIGSGLAGAGIKNWGGGVFCGDNTKGLPPKQIASCFTYNNVTKTYTNATCYTKPFVPLCGGNGKVFLNFGDIHYIAMGLSVVLFLVFLELFGSPFLRNCQVVLALLFGCFVSGVSKVAGNRYWDNKIIDDAPGITFLWVKTFPLSVYAPLLIPCLVTYLVTSIETIGDLTATREATHLSVEGEEFEQTVQGGLLGDAVNSCFACISGSTPNTTFAQNNAVIVLTRCGSRQAGYACAFWLVLCGALGKIGGFITAIPNCVLGGMTTFLFANVAISGIKIMAMSGLTRRDRFIAAIACGVGLGVDIAPQWATNHLWPLSSDMSNGVKGVRDAVLIILSNGFCIGALISIFLNLLLPADDKEVSVNHKEVEEDPVQPALKDVEQH